MAHIYSPLRYPGGKAKLVKFFKSLVDKNKLQDHRYIEPFAGGANVALSLLIDGYVPAITINDFDKAIYSFWISILTETETFIEQTQSCNLTIDEWFKQKEILNNPNRHSTLELGFAAFYLNRTNFSGVATGGPIGGYNQQGKYKLDARFNKIDLISRIRLIASYKNKITITNLDAIDLIKNLNSIEKTIIYFDPPYYIQGKKLYTNFYTKDDHRILAEKIKTVKSPWVLTYDNVEAIADLYQKIESHKISINYSANTHTKGRELMFLNNLPSKNRSFLSLAK